jgi:MFS transporter, AAHS family, vanillate permease
MRSDLMTGEGERRPQIRRLVVLGIVALIAGLDGFDGLAMAFVAPAIGSSWGIDKAAIGALFATGLFGMAGGALGLAPLGDLVGRKSALLLGLVLMGSGSFASGLAGTVAALAVYRLLTGLGIGLLVVLTTSVAAEYATERGRSLAVAATTVGFSLGGMLGGVASAAILHSHHWSVVFKLGGVLAGVLFIIALVLLPESPAFLISRQPRRALERLNRSLATLGEVPVDALPPTPPKHKSSYRLLFAPGMAFETVRYAAVYVLSATAVYYLLSWLPQLVADAGFEPSVGSTLSAAGSLVGIVGALTAGALARRFASMQLAGGAMIGFSASLAALGLVPPTIPMLLAAASACGFFVSATTALLYTAMTTIFPPSVRNSGLGFVMGMGRIVSGVGPLIAGKLFVSGLGRAEVSLLFAVIPVIAALLIMLPRRTMEE